MEDQAAWGETPWPGSAAALVWLRGSPAPSAFGMPTLLNTHLARATCRLTEVALGPREMMCHRGRA